MDYKKRKVTVLIYTSVSYCFSLVMEMRTVTSNIQEASPDIIFPNISNPRIRKWAKQTNVITLSPASLDEVAQGKIELICYYTRKTL